MAEFSVCLLLDKLIALPTKEAHQLRGIDREITEIKRELFTVRCFLKIADARAEVEEDNTNDGVKERVEQPREVAFQIEDVIDEYTYQLAQHPTYQHQFFSLFIGTINSLVNKIKLRYNIAPQIHDITSAVREIKKRSVRYSFNSIDKVGSINGGIQSQSTWHDPRKDALHLEEAEVVGIDSPRYELIGWLLNDQSRPHRIVISVVGMGGLGKTTLVKKVYDSVKGSFDCHAWVSVSQSYRAEDVLMNLIKSFCEESNKPIPERIDTMDGETLTRKLREYLKLKRYVVIFDDVWKVDFWGEVEHALLDNKNGGRVVITTRTMNVANFCKKSSFVHVHKLQPLTMVKAWELFCNKAFQFEYGGCCPIQLENLSHSIVERCEGLPLAIVAIGGLLSTKEKTFKAWKTLQDSLSSELESNPHLTSITRILLLSYGDLPYYLKSCFLYFGIFPEDYSTRCARLTQQWIAEGFIIPKKGKTQEAIAQEYLTELINRSLVQVSSVNMDGKVRSCRVHDLIREVILKKMGKLCFCRVLSEMIQQQKE